MKRQHHETVGQRYRSFHPVRAFLAMLTGGRVRRTSLATLVALVLAPGTAATQVTAALQAVKALQSATAGSVNPALYRLRVLDTKAIVDRHLAEEPSGQRRGAVGRAMDFHLVASVALMERLDRHGRILVSQYPVLETCPRAVEFVKRHEKVDGRGVRVIFGAETLRLAADTFWACASENIASAESKALRGLRRLQWSASGNRLV